jgi:type II secretory pathway component PulK
LLAVVVVVTILSLVAYQYNDRMTREYEGSRTALRAAQAKASADSGVHWLAALLSNPENLSSVVNNNMHDNPAAFQGRSIGASGSQAWRFSLISSADPEAGDSATLRFGVIDECGKINVNAIVKRGGRTAHDLLMKLPNMTEEAADSIIDWIDADSQPRTNGAENDHYSSLDTPYRAKNGPLESLEELLLVKGVNVDLLFGKDLNRNGIVDPDEEDGSNLSDLGWSAYLTVYSRELNVDAEGQPLLDVNGSDAQKLYDDLTAKVGEELAKYIILYRIYSSDTSQTRYSLAVVSYVDSGTTATYAAQVQSTVVEFSYALQVKDTKSSKSSERPKVKGSLAELSRDTLLKEKPKQKVSSFFDLIDSEVTVPGKGDKDPDVVYASPLKDEGQRRELLPKLFGSASTKKDKEISPRINVNTAAREVLTAIPNIQEADIESILAKRPSPSSPEAASPLYQTPAWLVTEANIKPQTLKRMENYITTRSQVYRVQSIGYSDGRGPSARVEAVIDTNAGRPRILYFRDLTELGKGAEAEMIGGQ